MTTLIFSPHHIQRINALHQAIVGFDEWDESKHPRAANGQFGKGKGSSQSAMKSVKANLSRGRAAMNTAIAEKRTVHRAMYHNELGWIDFEWGDDGLTKPLNKKGEPIGKGISHIIEARMRKDNMSYQEATKMLTHDIVETIAKGEVTQNQYNEKAKENRIHIEHSGYRAVLIKKKGNNGWMLTAFELHSSGGQRVGFDTTEPTHSKPTLTRQRMGALELKPTGEQVGSNDPSLSTQILPTRQRQDVGTVGSKSITNALSEVKERINKLHQRLVTGEK